MLLFTLLLTIAAYSYLRRCWFVSDDVDYLGKGKPPISPINARTWLNSGLDNIWVRLFGDNACKWHCTVVGYHLVSVCLLYFFAKRFFGMEIAQVATLLFALHPCANQGVAWISGRHYAMMGWFAIGGAWLSNLPITVFPLSYVATFIHPQGAMIPLVSMLNGFAWWKLVYLLFPLTLLSFFKKEIGRRYEISGWPKKDCDWTWARLNMLVKIANYYLFMALVPFRLGFYHANFFGYKQGLNSTNFKTFLGAFSLLVFTAVGVANYRSLPLLSYGFLWFYAFLLPCMNILHANMIFSERYMYVPLMGFCLALSSVLVLIPNYQMIVAVIATLYFVRTASYTLAYEDDIKLFNANIRNQRKSVEAHINLGDRWNVQHNRPDIALPLFQKAVELDPKSDLGWFNLGVAQHNLGLYEEAIKSWEKAIEVNPSYVNPRYNLIRLKKKLEDMKKKDWVPVKNELVRA